MKVNGIMGFGLPDDPNLAAEAATHAQLDGIWRGDTVTDGVLPLVLAAGLAPTLRVGTAITASFAYAPLALAQRAWAANEACGGRFILGLGAQSPAMTSARYGVSGSRPVRRMREYVAALRAVWSGWSANEPVTFDGEFYEFDTQNMSPPSTSTHLAAPAIHLAAVGDRMANMAGQVADGVLLSGLTRSYLEHRVLPAILDGTAQAGRSRDTVEIWHSCIVVTGATNDDVSAAHAAARRYIGHITAKPSYAALYRHHGWDDEFARLRDVAIGARHGSFEDVVTDEMVDQFALVGTIDEIGPMILARYGSVIDGVGLCLVAGGNGSDHRRIVEGVNRSKTDWISDV